MPYDEMVEAPPHYQTASIECIDAMKAMANAVEYHPDAMDITPHQAYLWQNSFKYLWRWPLKKKAAQDLKKCVWFIEKLIQDLEEDVQ
jgi:hypothetical protein